MQLLGDFLPLLRLPVPFVAEDDRIATKYKADKAGAAEDVTTLVAGQLMDQHRAQDRFPRVYLLTGSLLGSRQHLRSVALLSKYNREQPEDTEQADKTSD
jgi:hypothetical protein